MKMARIIIEGNLRDWSNKNYNLVNEMDTNKGGKTRHKHLETKIGNINLEIVYI